MRKDEVTAKPPKVPKMHSANAGPKGHGGRMSKPAAPFGKEKMSGPRTASGEGRRGFGNTNFGKPDHHGTTNVRSRSIDKMPGPGGGSRHINGVGVGGAGLGQHISSAVTPPSPGDVNSTGGDNPMPDIDAAGGGGGAFGFS